MRIPFNLRRVNEYNIAMTIQSLDNQTKQKRSYDIDNVDTSNIEDNIRLKSQPLNN